MIQLCGQSSRHDAVVELLVAQPIAPTKKQHRQLISGMFPTASTSSTNSKTADAAMAKFLLDPKSFTVAELKTLLRVAGQPVCGNKAELLDRLTGLDDHHDDDDDYDDDDYFSTDGEGKFLQPREMSPSVSHEMEEEKGRGLLIVDAAVGLRKCPDQGEYRVVGIKCEGMQEMGFVGRGCCYY